MQKSIHEKINTVLNEERRAYQANGRQHGGLGSFNIGIQQKWNVLGKIPELLCPKSDPNAVKSKNVDILLKLYCTLNKEDKKRFCDYLLTQLSRQSDYADVAYFILFVLHKTDTRVKALKKAQRTLKRDSVHGYSNFLAMLSQIVSYEYLTINQDEYNQIESLLQKDNEYNFQLIEKINSAKLKLLELKLQDVNPEINTDREELLGIWHREFPDSKIPDLIVGIEELFQGGEFADTKFATCIDRIRVLIVETTRNIALRIQKKRKDIKINKQSDEHTVFDYLRSAGFLEDAEWNLVRALHDLSSSSGVHAISSNRECARLIKNMTYEIVLLMLRKQI